MRRMLLVAIIALLGMGVLLVVADPVYSNVCPADGLLVETPRGWDLRRDHENDCVWTLFNESGERAPAELYVGLPIEAPPYEPRDYPNDGDALGWTMIVGSIVAGAMSLRARLP